MTTQSRWIKMAGLATAAIAKEVAFPFNTPASMLVEELVALATEQGSALKKLETKVDALIIGDYMAGIDYLKQALDVTKSAEERIYVIRRAEDLFMRSYYRMTNAEMLFEGASSAGMCAMLYCLTSSIDEAHMWFLRSEEAYLQVANATSTANSKGVPLSAVQLVGGLTAVFVGSVMTGGLSLVIMGAGAVAVGKTFVEADKVPDAEILNEKFVKDAKDCAVFMKEEAANVLALKNVKTETNSDSGLLEG